MLVKTTNKIMSEQKHKEKCQIHAGTNILEKENKQMEVSGKRKQK